MSTTTEDSLVFVRRMKLFRDLSEREKSIASSVFHVRRLEHGDVLCREGERGLSFYVTVQGTIEVHKELAADRKELLAEVGPDTMLGQVALIDRQARSATLMASGDAVVLECAVDDFDRLFWAGTPFAYKLLDMILIELSQRLRDADRALYDLYSNPGETLLKLHESAVDVQRVLSTGGRRDAS